MAVISPSPTVFGICSVAAAVQLLCLVHLVTSIVVLTQVSSVNVATWGGLLVSPVFQCIVGAWFLLGIPIIIHAGVGVVYRLESHMVVYMWYLAGTTAWAGVWLILFIYFGNSCRTEHSGGVSAATFICGVSNGAITLEMIMLLVALGFAIHLVGSMKDFIKVRQETELIRYHEPWKAIQALADDQALMQATAMKDAMARSRGQAGAAPPVYSSSTRG